MARHGKTTQNHHLLFLNILSKDILKNISKINFQSLSLSQTPCSSRREKKTSKSVTKPTADVDDESQNQITKNMVTNGGLDS